MPVHRFIDGPIMRTVIEGYNEYNTITQEMYLELIERFKQFERNRDLRIAILTGEGAKHFSVGGNLKRVRSIDTFFDRETILTRYWDREDYGPKEWVADPNFSVTGKKRKLSALKSGCALFHPGSYTFAGVSAHLDHAEKCCPVMYRFLERLMLRMEKRFLFGSHRQCRHFSNSRCDLLCTLKHHIVRDTFVQQSDSSGILRTEMLSSDQPHQRRMRDLITQPRKDRSTPPLKPYLISVKPNRAISPAMQISMREPKSISAVPRREPLTAAITGFRNSNNAMYV
nr:enoyl-CoA hydratase-related protein [Burkholderia cepacia]